jgi:hypothetical protein
MKPPVTLQQLTARVDGWDFWLDRGLLPEVTPAELVGTLMSLLGVLRAYEDIHQRIEDAHRIAHGAEGGAGAHAGRNVWHVALDEVDRLRALLGVR